MRTGSFSYAIDMQEQDSILYFVFLVQARSNGCA